LPRAPAQESDWPQAGFRISNSFSCFPLSEPERLLAPVCLAGPAGVKGLDFTTTGLAAGLHRQQVADDMLLRNAEVQYVCRMPLDNRTVVKFAAQTAIAGFFRLPLMSSRSKRSKVSSWLVVL
jgi:hypothetical protein